MRLRPGPGKNLKRELMQVWLNLGDVLHRFEIRAGGVVEMSVEFDQTASLCKTGNSLWLSNTARLRLKKSVVGIGERILGLGRDRF